MTGEEFFDELRRLMTARYGEVAQEQAPFSSEMLSDEAISEIHAIARSLAEQGHTEAAAQYEETAQWLASVRDSAVEQSAVPWAILARKYLCIPEYLYLDEAIAAAEAAGANDAADCLRLCRALKDDPPAMTSSQWGTQAHYLAKDYERQGRTEEAVTLELMALSVLTSLADEYVKFPVHERPQLREFAIRCARDAIELAASVPDDACRATFGMALAKALAEHGDRDAAIEACADALSLRRGLAAHEPEIYDFYLASSLNNFAALLADARQFPEALDTYREALDVARPRAARDPKRSQVAQVGEILYNSSDVMLELDRRDEAEAAVGEALTIFRGLAAAEPATYEERLAKALTQFGRVLAERSKHEEAERICDEAVALTRRLVERNPHLYEAGAAAALATQGIVLNTLQRSEKAIEVFSEALQIQRRLFAGDPQGFGEHLVWLLNNLGHAWMDVDFARSEALLLEASELCRTRGAGEFMLTGKTVLGGLCILRMKKEQWGEALEFVREAIALAERLYAESFAAERARQLMGRSVNLYEYEVVCLMKLGRTADAFTAAERGKARSLYDLLAQRERAEHQPETAAYRPGASTVNATEAQVLAVTMNATLVMMRVTAYGTFLFFVFPDGRMDTLTVDEFKDAHLLAMVATMDGPQPVGGWSLWYFRLSNLSAERSAAHVEYVRNPSPATLTALEEAGAEYEAALDRWTAEMDIVLAALYDQLMRHVLDRLRQHGIAEGSRVVVIPNSSLSILPLHACWRMDEQGRRDYLIDHYAWVSAPSLTILKACVERERAGRGKDTLFAVSNPTDDLPGSAAECSEIAKLFAPAHRLVLRGSDATVARVKTECQSRHVLHFACHGFSTMFAPLESGLMLAPEGDGEQADSGRLSFVEITRALDLRQASLAVLSACESALSGPAERADEFYSLATAFVIAGVPTVWGTLWSVDDEATKQLMVKGYRNLATMSKWQALREAQLELKCRASYAHPVYWAAMQNVGA